MCKILNCHPLPLLTMPGTDRPLRPLGMALLESVLRKSAVSKIFGRYLCFADFSSNQIFQDVLVVFGSYHRLLKLIIYRVDLIYEQTRRQKIRAPWGEQSRNPQP